NFATSTVTADTTLYAKWNAYPTVTFNSNGGSAVASVQQQTLNSVLAKPQDPTRTGYAFKGWKLGQYLSDLPDPSMTGQYFIKDNIYGGGLLSMHKDALTST